MHETVLDGMLRGEEGNDVSRIHVARQIGGQVAQVFLFRESDSIVGQENHRVMPGQSLDRVIHVDPELHAVRGRQTSPGWPQLDRRQGTVLAESLKHGAWS